MLPEPSQAACPVTRSCRDMVNLYHLAGYAGRDNKSRGFSMGTGDMKDIDWWRTSAPGQAELDDRLPATDAQRRKLRSMGLKAPRGLKRRQAERWIKKLPNYAYQTVDGARPLRIDEVFDRDKMPPREKANRRTKPASRKQRNWLVENGIIPPADLTYNEARLWTHAVRRPGLEHDRLRASVRIHLAAGLLFTTWRHIACLKHGPRGQSPQAYPTQVDISPMSAYEATYTDKHGSPWFERRKTHSYATIGNKFIAATPYRLTEFLRRVVFENNAPFSTVATACMTFRSVWHKAVIAALEKYPGKFNVLSGPSVPKDAIVYASNTSVAAPGHFLSLLNPASEPTIVPKAETTYFHLEQDGDLAIILWRAWREAVLEELSEERLQQAIEVALNPNP